MNAKLEMSTRRTRFLPFGRRRWVSVWASCGILAAGSATMVRAASLVPTGRPAPDLNLTTLDGKAVRLAELKGRVVLLLFGELYNRNTVAACKDVADVLARPAMGNIKTSAFLALAQDAPPAELLKQAKDRGVTLPILHDDGRRTFATYRVMILPSLVVIGPDGVTVLPCAGYPLDFKDMVADSILFASGLLSSGEFSRRRTATTKPAAPEAHVRAMRLASLGEQLARRGSDELAVGNFQDAIELDPDCVPARIGLGAYMLNHRRLADAENHFRHVLGTHADSVDAALGLIHVQIVRGGGELKSAEERLRELLRKQPNNPKVVYLAGLVAEKSGDADAALGHYRRSAELLLYGQAKR